MGMAFKTSISLGFVPVSRLSSTGSHVNVCAGFDDRIIMII